MNQTHHGKPEPFPKRVSTSSLDTSLSHSYLHAAASVTWGAFGHLSSSAVPWDRAVPRGHKATPAVRVGSHGQEARGAGSTCCCGDPLVTNMPSFFVEQHREARRKPPG